MVQTKKRRYPDITKTCRVLKDGAEMDGGLLFKSATPKIAEVLWIMIMHPLSGNREVTAKHRHH